MVPGKKDCGDVGVGGLQRELTILLTGNKQCQVLEQNKRMKTDLESCTGAFLWGRYVHRIITDRSTANCSEHLGLVASRDTAPNGRANHTL